ncbi:A/G-specific adenine glycosylase [uncultured Desulfuromonas sp.]|uniref:A/G-specific adenine glycosylase n=1 Tax=uncultured Desulfuromonas sp. TaxID=181013 RepID=UPI002631ADA1|nr:A/G-specific adenine glycosylase [uncultured Desulfuromonas sp.]
MTDHRSPFSDHGFLFAPSDISGRLLDWYGRQGRDLPWRRTRDPYRVWLSEVMLQQTTVAAVVPYYETFLERFPNVADLAAAPVEEVIESWAGLGYYSRARNLHAAAQRVVSLFGGSFPDDLEGLMSLPGVGRSTAGAILSIAFDRKAPILDGNVRRVLCRLYALKEDPRASASEKRLWAWAEELTSADRPHDYAQAIMDLGATICIPRRPDCPACPLEGLCRARRMGVEAELPLRRKGRVVPQRTEVALLLEREGRFLVRRRPLEGMLGGLWEFPGGGVPEGSEPLAAGKALLRDMGLAGELRPAGRVRHVYSHFRLDLHLLRGEVEETFRVGEGAQDRWLSPGELTVLPLHGAHKKALDHLASAV